MQHQTPLNTPKRTPTCRYSGLCSDFSGLFNSACCTAPRHHAKPVTEGALSLAAPSGGGKHDFPVHFHLRSLFFASSVVNIILVALLILVFFLPILR